MRLIYLASALEALLILGLIIAIGQLTNEKNSLEYEINCFKEFYYSVKDSTEYNDTALIRVHSLNHPDEMPLNKKIVNR